MAQKGAYSRCKTANIDASMLEIPTSWGTARPFPILGSARSSSYQPYLKSSG
jgi:hypothetical protein